MSLVRSTPIHDVSSVPSNYVLMQIVCQQDIRCDAWTIDLTWALFRSCWWACRGDEDNKKVVCLPSDASAECWLGHPYRYFVGMPANVLPFNIRDRIKLLRLLNIRRNDCSIFVAGIEMKQHDMKWIQRFEYHKQGFQRSTEWKCMSRAENCFSMENYSAKVRVGNGFERKNQWLRFQGRIERRWRTFGVQVLLFSGKSPTEEQSMWIPNGPSQWPNVYSLEMPSERPHIGALNSNLQIFILKIS